MEVGQTMLEGRETGRCHQTTTGSYHSGLGLGLGVEDMKLTAGATKYITAQ